MEMFKDHEYVDRFHGKDKVNYFPTISTQSSVDYGPVKSDHNSNQILVTELTLGHNSLIINDDHLPFND